MSNTPNELKYAASHEWAKRLDDDIVEVGISDYAQESLGDVVYVELPDIGQSVVAGEECSAVESVKAASDIYAPVSGEIIAINEELDSAPELLNESPYDNGWMFRIKASDITQLDQLLSANDYDAQNQDWIFITEPTTHKFYLLQSTFWVLATSLASSLDRLYLWGSQMIAALLD